MVTRGIPRLIYGLRTPVTGRVMSVLVTARVGFMVVLTGTGAITTHLITIAIRVIGVITLIMVTDIEGSTGTGRIAGRRIVPTMHIHLIAIIIEVIMVMSMTGGIAVETIITPENPENKRLW